MRRGAKIPTNVLKDALCKGAKAGTKVQKLYDGGGLFLDVLPSGAKIWRLAYRFGGKPKTKAYGPYPAVSLAEARIKRDADKSLQLRFIRYRLAETVEILLRFFKPPELRIHRADSRRHLDDVL